MKRHLFLFILLLVSSFLLIACSDTKYLTRVDVQIVNKDETHEAEKMIIDLVTLDSIESFFQKVEWEKDIKEESKNKEDLQLTVFYVDEDNKDETLYLYRLWFHDDNAVTIISTNEEEPYGTLDGKSGLKLKNLLIP